MRFRDAGSSISPVLDRAAGATKRAVGWQPHVETIVRQRLYGQIAFRGKRTEFPAQYQQRADAYDLGPKTLEVVERSPNSRAGADYVIHDGHSPPSSNRTKHFREPVFHGIHFLPERVSDTFGIRKFNVELGRYQQTHERTFREWPADKLRLILGQLGREFSDEWTHPGGAQAKRLKVHPVVRVVAGFELEMPHTSEDR
jgi:hypothetical protein